MKLIEKVNLYCDLNDISLPERFSTFAVLLETVVENKKIKNIHVRNSEDFLVQGMRDLAHGIIDDEQFFQIGDITSDRIIKTTRPHLNALQLIEGDIQSDTLYVLDNAAKIAYEYAHKNIDALVEKIHTQNSEVAFIENA